MRHYTLYAGWSCPTGSFLSFQRQQGRSFLPCCFFFCAREKQSHRPVVCVCVDKNSNELSFFFKCINKGAPPRSRLTFFPGIKVEFRTFSFLFLMYLIPDETCTWPGVRSVVGLCLCVLKVSQRSIKSHNSMWQRAVSISKSCFQLIRWTSFLSQQKLMNFLMILSQLDK